jgi:hypothetical protein
MRAPLCWSGRGTMKNRDIKALPIKNHGDTDAIFIDNVAAIIERSTVTHVILASVQATADSEFPSALYRRVMVRLIIPTDRCYEIGKQIAAGRADGWLARILKVRSLPIISRSFATATDAGSSSVLSPTAIGSWLRRVLSARAGARDHFDGSRGPGRQAQGETEPASKQ